MSQSKQEAVLFQKALDQSSSEVIAKRLEDNVIARTWKRELAEQELTRRQNEKADRLASIERQASKNHQTAKIQAWVFSIVLMMIIGVGAAAFFWNK